jgi:hypothetical protein
MPLPSDRRSIQGRYGIVRCCAVWYWAPARVLHSPIRRRKGWESGNGERRRNEREVVKVVLRQWASNGSRA